MNLQQYPEPLAGLNEAGEEEVRLIDLWRILARGRKWVLGIPLLAIVGALIFVYTVRPEWEATAVIQVGQVGQGGVGQASAFIEPVQRAVERMRLKSFEDSVLARLKTPLNEGNRDAKLFRGSLKVKVLPNSDLIEIRVRGYSREEALNRIQGIVQHLSTIHQELAAPSIQRLNLLLAEVKETLQKTENERASLLKNLALKEKIGPGNRFAENVLLANIITSKDAEIRDLRQRKLALEEQLSPVRTYPTSLIDQAYVPAGPVYPRKRLTVVLAGAAGLMAGVMAALLADYLRRVSMSA